MDAEGFVAIIIAILALLVITGFLRYKTSVKTAFSFRDWIKFSFSGSNQDDSEKAPREQLVTKVEPDAQIIAEEFVGRDKITNIYNRDPNPEISSSPVKLELKLFTLDRDQTHKKELTFIQNTKSIPWTRVFGLALNNLSEFVASKGISIRLEFYWRGDFPSTAPSFQVPPRLNGWETRIPQLMNEQPAVLVFRDASLTCFPGHPIEWRGFKLSLQEQMRGYFLILYKVSSAQPYSDNSSELKINIGG